MTRWPLLLVEAEDEITGEGEDWRASLSAPRFQLRWPALVAALAGWLAVLACAGMTVLALDLVL